MSHISKIELEINDLATLKKACSRLGLEFLNNQKTFKWFGKQSECNHAIKIPDGKYEIGVIKSGAGYELQCDYYDQSIGKAIGENGGLLKQAYAIERTKAEARRKGYSITEKKVESGVRLRLLIH